MQRQFRRVITGHDQEGRAVVNSDGPAPFVHVKQGDPEWYSADLFRTGDAPVCVLAQTPETTAGQRRQLPTKNGTVLRINHFPPELEDVQRMTPDDARRVFAALGNERASTYGRGGRHPLMHRTETVDYAIVVEGEITMILDTQDVLLRAGDVVVQCGTNHAWSNRSDKPAVVAFVLIDGTYEPTLKERFG